MRSSLLLTPRLLSSLPLNKRTIAFRDKLVVGSTVDIRMPEFDGKPEHIQLHARIEQLDFSQSEAEISWVYKQERRKYRMFSIYQFLPSEPDYFLIFEISSSFFGTTFFLV